jgi:hypothetical protein
LQYPFNAPDFTTPHSQAGGGIRRPSLDGFLVFVRLDGFLVFVRLDGL